MSISTVGELNSELSALVTETGLYSDERGQQLHVNVMLIVKSVLRKRDIILSERGEFALSTPIDSQFKFELIGGLDTHLMYEGSLEAFSEGFDSHNTDIFQAIIVLKSEGDKKGFKKGIRDLRAAANREKIKIHPRLNKLLLAILKKDAEFDSYIKELIESGDLAAKEISLSATCKSFVDGVKLVLGDTLDIRN